MFYVEYKDKNNVYRIKRTSTQEVVYLTEEELIEFIQKGNKVYRTTVKDDGTISTSIYNTIQGLVNSQQTREKLTGSHVYSYEVEKDRYVRVSYIGDTANRNIKVPEIANILGERCYQGCAVTNIEIPEHIISMEMCSFLLCRELEQIYIPESVRSIGESCFSYCSKLKEVIIDGEIEILPDMTFHMCTALETVRLPNTLKRVQGFNLCEKLKEISIPEGVTELGDSAFEYCTSLQTVKLPLSLQVIGSSAFSACYSLTELILPDNVKTVESKAFMGCGRLKRVSFPSTIEHIAYDAFAGCFNDIVKEYR